MIDKSKSVLLIGSDGFLGNWFRDILDENGNKYATYDIQSGNDICDGMGDIPRYDYVINCAGIASPEKYMKQPVETMDVSYIGTKNVLDYCVDNVYVNLLQYVKYIDDITKEQTVIDRPQNVDVKGNKTLMPNHFV